jgi:hypothetical protein
MEDMILGSDFLCHIHHFFKEWMCMPSEIEDLDFTHDLLHNARTRNTFQVILSIMIKQVNRFTMSLVADKEDKARDIVEFPDDEDLMIDNAKHLDNLAMALSGWVRLLCYLTTTKGALLEIHLKYLQDAFQLEHTYA